MVTGASSGIGAAVTDQLLAVGAKVLGISRRKITGELSCKNNGMQNLESVQCDLSDFNQLEKTLTAMLKANPDLAGAILCHGFGDFCSLEELSAARVRRQIDTNLTSSILVSRLAIPVLKKNRRGDLIIIGSESGRTGGKKGAVYCATKFGLRGFVQALRPECASSGVRVAIVNPGMVDTPFFNDLDFSPGEARENAMRADEVAKAVQSIIDMPAGAVIDEINLSPQKTVIRNKSPIPGTSHNS